VCLFLLEPVVCVKCSDCVYVLSVYMCSVWGVYMCSALLYCVYATIPVCVSLWDQCAYVCIYLNHVFINTSYDDAYISYDVVHEYLQYMCIRELHMYCTITLEYFSY